MRKNYRAEINTKIAKESSGVYMDRWFMDAGQASSLASWDLLFALAHTQGQVGAAPSEGVFRILSRS